MLTCGLQAVGHSRAGLQTTRAHGPAQECYGQRGMRRLTETSLSNAALYYLGRYAASRKGLTEVLRRKVKRHQLKTKETPPTDIEATIAKVVNKMVHSGYVDDVKLAEAKVNSLQRKGKSTRVIRLTLKAKGIPTEVIAQSTKIDATQELESALTLVRKKKLGTKIERRQKDFAVLMRAGFSIDVVKQALAQAKQALSTGADVNN